MKARALAVSLNTRIHDKPSAWREEYADNWQSVEVQLEGLRDAICLGYAFIAAAMRSPHRSSAAFLHADLAVVDIDHGLDLEAFRQHPLARHACLTYTSCSHQDEPGKHRFRVIFRLPERISDPELYKAVVTALIKALGGDKSCSDPCRLYYGNSRCQYWLGAPDACLPESFVADARKEQLRQRTSIEERSEDYDETSIGQAIHVFEHVLVPTADGERDLFVRITAAAASAGDALFPAWSDWASKGHHGSGKNRKQTTERFFRGFSGRSSLGTLFFLASQQDPDWRDSLPDELRSTGHFDSKLPPGYRHEDFLGYDDPEYSTAKPSKYRTPSILEWAAAQEAQAEQAPAAVAEPAAQPAVGGDDDALPPMPPHVAALMAEAVPDDGDVDPEFMGSPDDLLIPLVSGETPLPPEPPGKRGRGRKGKASFSGGGGEVAKILAKVKSLYPGLRLNKLTQDLECGPMDDPTVIDDADKAYLLISASEDKPFAKTHVYDTVHLSAQRNGYNPVHRFLDECAKHEPIDYFDTLATTLLGVPGEGPDNPRMPCGRLLADLILRRFLIAAVARARQPGCSMGWMPILIGPQNVGKTNFFQYLTPPNPLSNNYTWCPTIQQGISYLKEKPHALHAGWIVNLDEVERFFRRQYTEEFKNLVTVSVDRSARKWENERLFQRAFVLVGCSNNKDFMVDPTGNRRFLPVTVHGVAPSPQDPSVKIIDLDRVKADRMNIWAAAQQAYLDEPLYEFSSYEISLISDFLNSHTIDSPITGALQAALSRNASFVQDGQPFYLLSDIFKWLEISIDPRNGSNNGITDELKRLGFDCKRVRRYGKQVRAWFAVSPPRPADGIDIPLDWGT
jgi:hypothetical protein